MITGSKTDSYIKSLSSSEKRALIDFTESPYFNTNAELIRLLKVLINPDANDAATVYRKTTGKKFSEQKLRYLLSDLNLLIEEFLAVNNFRNQQLGKKQALVYALKEKKIHRHAKKHQEQLLQLNDVNQLQDANMLALKLKSEEISYALAAELDNRSLDTRLQKLSDSIDVYYFAIKLKYACEMINRGNVLQVKYNTHFIDSIKAFLPDSEFLKVPAVSIYFHILNTLQDPENENHYSLLKNELKLNRHRFSVSELRDMFTFAQNYCIRRLNSGESKYLEELFLNYDYLLQEKILLVNNIISQFDFKNIVTIALRLGKFDWVKNFISSYTAFLHDADRKNAEVYNLSRLYYSAGDAKRAMKLMQHVEFTDVYYHLDAKILLLKIYFDTNAVENFLPLATSFGNYLKRNKSVSAYQRLTYMNFLKLIKKLFNYKAFEKGSAVKLNEEITSTQNIADVNWLKQKAELLLA